MNYSSFGMKCNIYLQHFVTTKGQSLKRAVFQQLSNSKGSYTKDGTQKLSYPKGSYPIGVVPQNARSPKGSYLKRELPQNGTLQKCRISKCRATTGSYHKWVVP